jgi:hypothetical protein
MTVRSATALRKLLPLAPAGDGLELGGEAQIAVQPAKIEG